MDTATDQETAVDEGEPKETVVVDESKEEEEEALPEDDGLNPAQREANQLLIKEGSFLGYENPPRKRLALDEDNRPKSWFVGNFEINDW